MSTFSMLNGRPTNSASRRFSALMESFPRCENLNTAMADADNDHACNHAQDAAQADSLTENIHMQNFLFCIVRLEGSPQGEPYGVIYNNYPVKCTPLSRVNLFKISHLTL